MGLCCRGRGRLDTGPRKSDSEGRSLAAVLQRLTPDRAFSAVAVLIAAVSAWFSYQANQLQQDVRMRAQADQVVLMQLTTDDDASPSAVPTQDSEHHVVVQNHSRLPVREVWIVALPPAPRTAIAIEVGMMDSCEQAQAPRAAILAACGCPRTRRSTSSSGSRTPAAPPGNDTCTARPAHGSSPCPGLRSVTPL